MHAVFEKLTGRFELGRTVATANAHATLDPGTMLDVLTRHAAGDWGDVATDSRTANERAVREEAGSDRIFSRYFVEGAGTLGLAVEVWVITEADRSATTVLLPEDY